MAAPNDIVVVGAGIIGCAVGYELARRGASVRIVDDRPAGMGATQASAGMLAPYIEAPEGHPLLDLTFKSLALFDAFMDRVGSDSDIIPLYRRTGTLEVAMNERELERLQMLAAALNRKGVPAQMLDAKATRVEEPHLAEGAAGSLLVGAHGYVAAGDLTLALAEGARRHGAELLEGRVRRISAGADAVRVETDRGSLTGGRVVLAAGSWSGQIAIDGVATPIPVSPVRGQLLHLGWTGPTLKRVLWSERCYMVPWDNGTLLVGATVEEAGFDERTTTAAVRDLIEAAAELVPNVWRAAFSAARAGLRPATPDDLPMIGWSSVVPSLMYATGHFRNGVLLSPLTALLVADAILDNRLDPMLAATSPQRFGRL